MVWIGRYDHDNGFDLHPIVVFDLHSRLIKVTVGVGSFF